MRRRTAIFLWFAILAAAPAWGQEGPAVDGQDLADRLLDRAGLGRVGVLREGGPWNKLDLQAAQDAGIVFERAQFSSAYALAIEGGRVPPFPGALSLHRPLLDGVPEILALLPEIDGADWAEILARRDALVDGWRNSFPDVPSRDASAPFMVLPGQDRGGGPRPPILWPSGFKPTKLGSGGPSALQPVTVLPSLTEISSPGDLYAYCRGRAMRDCLVGNIRQLGFAEASAPFASITRLDSGFLDYQYDSRGFGEMALFDQMAPGGAVGNCTAVMLSAQWALTALHCIGRNATQVTRFARITNGAVPELVGWESDSGTFVVTIIASNRKPVVVPVVAFYFASAVPPQWDAAVAPPDPDFALLRLNPPTGVRPLRVASLSRSLPDAGPITLAGFGLTNVANPEWRRSFLVTVNVAISVDHNTLSWNGAERNGSACFGDSGGPVFDDWIAGYRGEPHVVLALTSALVGASGMGADSCIRSTEVRATVLADHVDAICRVTGGDAEGCQ